MGNSLELVKKGRHGYQPAGPMEEEGVMDSPLQCLDLMRTERVGPALGSAHHVALGPVTLVPAVQVSSGTLPLAFLSTVEYPLQLLHSPPAPVVKRSGVTTHHPLQVLPAHCVGCPPPLLSFFPSWLLWAGALVSLSPRALSVPRRGGRGVLWCLSLSDFLGPQEPPQPLNLTAKPKAPELPNTSSSPSLKMNSCGPHPSSHGAPTRDLQSSPPSLPLGKLSYLLSPRRTVESAVGTSLPFLGSSVGF